MAVFHDEVEIEDFQYDEDSETYFYPCPCGDNFCITKVTGGSSEWARVSLPSSCRGPARLRVKRFLFSSLSEFSQSRDFAPSMVLAFSQALGERGGGGWQRVPIFSPTPATQASPP